MGVSDQKRDPSLARLRTSPRQTTPAPMVRHIPAKNSLGWNPELTIRWLLPSNSSREYFDTSQNLSLT